MHVVVWLNRLSRWSGVNLRDNNLLLLAYAGLCLETQVYRKEQPTEQPTRRGKDRNRSGRATVSSVGEEAKQRRDNGQRHKQKTSPKQHCDKSWRREPRQFTTGKAVTGGIPPYWLRARAPRLPGEMKREKEKGKKLFGSLSGSVCLPTLRHASYRLTSRSSLFRLLPITTTPTWQSTQAEQTKVRPKRGR